MTKKDWKRLSVCMTPEEYQKLRVLAAESGISMSEVVRTLVLAYRVERDLKTNTLNEGK